MRPNPRDATVGPYTPDQLAGIETALEHVLASPAFRKSDQCRKFLRFVVEHSIFGADESLKERNIGVEVFGRAPDYDTADDPVVRVRATEVRKRLAQYHGETTATGEPRFEIPSGSYRVEFHWTAANVADAVVIPAARSRSRRIAFPVAVLAILAAGTVLVFSRRPAAAAIDRFWAPVLASHKPVLVYCGQPVVYFLSRNIHDRYRDMPAQQAERGSYVVNLDPNEVIQGRDIIPVTEQFVGIGNAHTAILLSGLFAEKHKPLEIRYANDLSFSDLRGSPSVLIGAFSNLWTLEMQGGSRFIFEQERGVRRIRDRTNSRTWQLANLAPDGKTPEDYAIVSRLSDSPTGQLLISAAGITQYGTRAAGELLTSASLLERALSQAPADWSKRNLQILLRTTVYKGTPAPPQVVATHAW